jgi:CBS-domain-containing membrane protein
MTTDVEATREPGLHMLRARDIMSREFTDQDGPPSERELADSAPSDEPYDEPYDEIVDEEDIGDGMTPQLLAVYADDPALAAATMMAETQAHRVLVLDEEERVIGVITARDLVRALARGDRFERDALDGDAPLR